MSEPFLSELRIVGFNFAPRGWALCDGQILPINQYQSLYSLLGTVYGGDGRTTFGLPELRGRGAVHPGANGVVQGTRTGAENVVLTTAQIPTHDHTMSGTSADAVATNPTPIGQALARATTPLYHSAANLVSLDANSVGNAGGSQAHTNMQPWIALNFCIALQGVFPSRN